MSVIDERVVQMEFDNQRFEKNVSTSISTLDKLKSALKFDNATKGIQQVESYSRGFNLNGISSAVETISSKFTLLGIVGMTALQNIVNKAVDAGERVVKSLSVDQIMSGWNKYADKTSAVQTIMAATADTWDEYSQSIEYVGSQMDYVNDQMQKLNWFTDETSYNFVDMVSNIGKFTANAIPLDKAVTSMQGIATWAAVSGQNASTASRVMYNLAQAIGSGQVKLQDFMSLETANMATASFKAKVIEVAEEMGKLKRDAKGVLYAVDETGSKSKNVEVNLANFRNTLSSGWFSKDVLVKVLDEYGSFTNELYEFSEAVDLTATEILALVEAQEAGSLSAEQLSDLSSETGISVEDLREKIESLASEENKFGRAAFRAAQEAKTFQEAVDSVKEAAATKWMNIFENIFGDYEKARHLWTDFAEFLYDILITPLERVEKISKTLGRLDAVRRIAKAIGDVSGFLFNGNENSRGILESLRTGFERVIPPIEITTSQIATAIDKIRNFGANLKLTGQQASLLRQAGQGLASILTYVGNTISNFWAATENLRNAIVNIASAIGGLILKLFAANKDIDTSGAKAETFQKICDKLAEIIDKVAEAINNIEIKDIKEKLETISSVISTVTGAFGQFIDGIASLGSTLGSIDVLGGIADAFQHIKDFLTGTNWSTVFKVGFGAALTGFVAYNGYIIHWLLTPLKNLSEMVGEFADQLWTMNLERLSTTLKNIAIAIGLLAVSLLILSYVDYTKAAAGLVIITGILAALYLTLESMKGISVKSVGKFTAFAAALVLVASAMLILSVSLAILAGALALFALVAKMDTIAEGLLYMAATLAVAVIALAALSQIGPKVIFSAAALLILSGALILLASALALFALVAKMDTIAEGLLYMAATLAVAVIALAALSQIGPKVLIGAVALVILSGALILLAGALALFSAVAKMDTIAEGLLYMAATLAVTIAGLMVLATAGPMIIIAAASILIVSAALLVLAGALAAFSAIAGMEGAWGGIAILVTLLAALSLALFVLSLNALGTLAAAGSLLLVAAACLVLAAAVAVVGLALPILATGLSALAVAIGAALTSISEGIKNWVINLSAALGAVGEALGEIIAAIGEALGTAVGSLGEGIGEAIASIISSVGVGIGEGITAISDAIGTFGENLTNAGLGIENFGESIRSLKGIDWLGTAVGIGELAVALNKLKVENLATNLGDASSAIVTMCTDSVTALTSAIPVMMDAAQNMGQAIAEGIRSRQSEVKLTATRVASAAITAISAYSGKWYSLGASVSQGFANGIRSKISEVTAAVKEMAKEAEKTITITIQSHSPSKVTTRLGEYFGQGFANGIRSEIPNTSNAAKDMVNKTIKTLDMAKSLITSILEDDFTPVITPVIDMSSVTDSIKNAPALSVAAGIRNAAMVGGSSTTTANQNGSDFAKSNASYYTFNQYNTSPKSLSRIEIYRQTKNLISMQKEATSI